MSSEDSRAYNYTYMALEHILLRSYFLRENSARTSHYISNSVLFHSVPITETT